MPIHVLRSAQIVPATIDECWDFFSNPRNLARITPPALDFHILSDLPPAIYPGMMIEYRVRPLLGIPMTWLTEITQVEPQRHFVDEQRVGPYAIWHHEHFFTALDGGRTEIRDVVHYVLPFGWLGNMVHPFLVTPELRKIFAFRERAVTEIFGDATQPAATARARA
jgi:ligand-binding SRPBCC domain-containing protein